MKIIMILFSLGFLISANKPATKKAEEKCNRAGPQNEMNRCAVLDYKKADKELNKTYKELRKHTDKNKLLKVQKAWLQYRDLHCQYLADLYEGGSMTPLIYNRCLENLTITRTKELKNYMNP